MSPREIIAATIPGEDSQYQLADAILDALTTAGFRIVGPGEVDPETVEKCAAELEKPRKFIDGTEVALPSALACAAALRALKEKRPVPERFARLSPDPRAVIPDDASGELTATSTAELIALKEKQS